MARALSQSDCEVIDLRAWSFSLDRRDADAAQVGDDRWPVGKSLAFAVLMSTAFWMMLGTLIYSVV